MSTQFPPESKERAHLPGALAIDHPDFRYSGTRNPYSAKLRTLPGRNYQDQETEGKAGQWRSLLPDSQSAVGENRPLTVEIGCNGGHVIRELASQNPTQGWIGIDWKFKQVYAGVEKAQRQGTNNLLFLRANAERLHFIFGPGEITTLNLYFPDPWAKRSQLKNRLFREQWLRRIAPLMTSGGTFHVKTDHAGYFEWMLEHAQRVSDLFEIKTFTQHKWKDHPAPQQLNIPQVTLFERLFIKDGLPIHELYLERITK